MSFGTFERRSVLLVVASGEEERLSIFVRKAFLDPVLERRNFRS
jgi:hypothetical protein